MSQKVRHDWVTFTSLLFNMLSRFVIAFLPRSKCLLFHGCSHHLQGFWSPIKKVCHSFHCFPIYLPWSDGSRCHDLHSLNVEFEASFVTLFVTAACQVSLSPCLFNLEAEYVMWNARLDEAQAEVKVSRRNINNVRWAEDTTLMAESEAELKRL